MFLLQQHMPIIWCVSRFEPPDPLVSSGASIACRFIEGRRDTREYPQAANEREMDHGNLWVPIMEFGKFITETHCIGIGQ